MAERFKLEARTAAQLSHPHIIPIYAVKETADTLFFVMKYVEGRALDDIIKKSGQLPIPMVRDILIKVGSALLTTTAVLVGGLGALLFSSMPLVQLFGMIASVGLAAAYIGDVLVLPALIAWSERKSTIAN